MKKIPPHLPSPFCDIKDHHALQRLKMILAAAVFGLLAGLSGAAVMLGWIWPGIGGGDLWAVSQSRNASAREQLDEQVRNEKVDGRLAGVYSTALPFGQTAYLAPADKLGDAMIVGSDGWLAMYRPAGLANYKNWRVILSNGSVYRLETALFDRYAGFVYMKIIKGQKDGQDSIQLNNLVDYREAELRSWDDIFVYQNKNWYHGLATYAVREVRTLPHLDTAPNQYFALDGSYTAGSIVINRQGRVVGVVTEKNLLLPITYLARVLPRVLSEQGIAYPTLGVEGWFDNEQPVIAGGEKIAGFAVSRVFAGTALKKSDIIMEINGEIVSMDKMWYNKNQVLRLKVWRNGKFLELEIKVLEIS